MPKFSITRESPAFLPCIRYPEAFDAHKNVYCGKALTFNVTSTYHELALEELEEMVAPRFVEAGIWRRDSTSPSGFSTDYEEVEFDHTTMSYDIVAQMIGNRAPVMARMYQPTDTPKNAALTYISFQNASDETINNALEVMRSASQRVLEAPDGEMDTGRAMHVVVMVRAASSDVIAGVRK